MHPFSGWHYFLWRVVLSVLCGGPKMSPRTNIWCSYYSSPKVCCTIIFWSPAGKELSSWLSCFFHFPKYVLVNIRIKGKVCAMKLVKPSSQIFLLTVPRRYFFCGSFMFYLSCVCYAFVQVCLFVPCGHLLGKDWPLGSLLWCLTVSLSLSHWYPGPGVVLDCIDSWYLHPYLLW